MSMRAKMRLMILLGIVMIALTTAVVLYGFKKTEELRSEAHTQELMREPRAASFGDVPVGLIIGQGGSVLPAEGQAKFDDGLVATLTTIERVHASGSVPEGTYVATLHLQGGTIRQTEGIDIRISSAAAQWADQGYLVTLLEIDPRSMVFTVNQTNVR